MSIDWLAFLEVFAAALVASSLVVLLYAVGLRLLVSGGRPPVVVPAEFTDAITVITEKERGRAMRAASKAASRSPLTPGRQRLALVGAYASFALCGLAVAGGIVLVVIGI